MDVHTRGKPLGRGRPRPDRAPDLGPDRRRPCQPLQRGGDLRGPQAPRHPIVHADFDAALECVVAGMQSRRTLNDPRAPASSRSTRPATRCAPSCCRASTGCTRSRSSPAARALGYTLNLPEEDRYLKTREELIDYMTVLLGGRAAEEIVFGAITTGASDDLSPSVTPAPQPIILSTSRVQPGMVRRC